MLGHLGNTLGAFARSRAAGADGVELDVRRAGDGALVVHHDPIIEGVGAIVELSRDLLPPGVALLEDALRECSGMTVNVEIKNLPIDPDYDPTEEIVGLVLAAVYAAGAGERVIVSSFSLASIDAARAVAPATRTALLTLPSWDQARAITATAAHGHHALHPHRRSLDVDLVDRARAAGLSVHPWGVDDPASALSAEALGVEAIITDDPVAVLAVLHR